jgi:predicted DNA-binding transcriptional regulator AlpA
MQLLPRLIRLRDVPTYLGMDRHRFNSDVRPNIREIPIGSRGIAFDRLDLDAWVDHYKRCIVVPRHPTIGVWKYGTKTDARAL